MNKDENQLTAWSVIKSALASLMGVQKRSNFERDFSSGNPWHFIAAGLIVTVLFILTLWLVVSMVLRGIPAG
jgi:uncharacterized membrane protein YhdT